MVSNANCDSVSFIMEGEGSKCTGLKSGGPIPWQAGGWPSTERLSCCGEFFINVLSRRFHKNPFVFARPLLLQRLLFLFCGLGVPTLVRLPFGQNNFFHLQNRSNSTLEMGLLRVHVLKIVEQA